jgi:hypothetical protein
MKGLEVDNIEDMELPEMALEDFEMPALVFELEDLELPDFEFDDDCICCNRPL